MTLWNLAHVAHVAWLGQIVLENFFGWWELGRGGDPEKTGDVGYCQWSILVERPRRGMRLSWARHGQRHDICVGFGLNAVGII
jgi:hypothetical protein